MTMIDSERATPARWMEQLLGKEQMRSASPAVSCREEEPHMSKAWSAMTESARRTMLDYSSVLASEGRTHPRTEAVARQLLGACEEPISAFADASVRDALAGYHEAAARLLRARPGADARSAVDVLRDQVLAAADLIVLRFEGDVRRLREHAGRVVDATKKVALDAAVERAVLGGAVAYYSAVVRECVRAKNAQISVENAAMRDMILGQRSARRP